MQEKQTIEGEFLSSSAEKILSDQLDDAEVIDVDVQTDLFKIFQGQADGVSFTGQGLVMQKNIRVEEIEVQTDKVSVNPLSALFGEIKLNEPVKANIRVVLKEEDINKALASNYLSSKLQKIDLNVEGQVVSLLPQSIQIFFPAQGKMAFKGIVQVQEKGNSRILGFTASAQPRTLNKPIILDSFNCTQGEGLSLETIVALMQKVKELVNLPYLEFEGTAFRVRSMAVNQGSVTLVLQSYMREIPSM